MLYNNVIIQVNIHFAIVAIGNDYESNGCEYPLETSPGRGVHGEGFHTKLRACHALEHAEAVPLVNAVALWSGLVVEDLAWTESKELSRHLPARRHTAS